MGLTVRWRTAIASISIIQPGCASAETAAVDADGGHGDRDADVLYGHGQVWNRDLPGVAGELKLAFDLRVNLQTGAGFETASDPVFPEWDTTAIAIALGDLSFGGARLVGIAMIAVPIGLLVPAVHA